MPVDLLLLPSPLLPAAPYAPLVRALADRGHRCLAASAAGAHSPAQLIERWSAQASADASLLAHSNAGYLAPAVRAAAEGDRRIVFMDAALPPVEGDTALAPAGLRSHLGSLVDPTTGTLPPWTRWWPKQQLLRTIPADAFDTIDASCPRMPISYFDSRVRAPERWVERSNAYLAFGATYSDEVELARRFDWPTRTLDGGHLEFLWNVDLVADSVSELLGS